MTLHTYSRFYSSHKPVRPKFDSDTPSYLLTEEEAVAAWNFPEYSIALQIEDESDISILSSTNFSLYIENLFLVWEVDGAVKEAIPVHFPLTLGIQYIESVFTVYVNEEASIVYVPVHRNLGAVVLYEDSSLLDFSSRIYTYRKQLIPDCLEQLFDVDTYTFAFTPTSLSNSLSKGLTSTYTLIAKGDVEEGLLAGIWEPLGYQDWRIDREDGQLRLTIRQTTNVVESFDVENLYELAVTRSHNDFALYINGIERYYLLTEFLPLTNNLIAGEGIETQFYDYLFITEEYYAGSYTPNCFSASYTVPVRNRAYSNYEYMNNRSDLEYSITGETSVATNSLQTYTLTLSGNTKLAKSCTASIKPLYSFDTVAGINPSTDLLTVAGGSSTATLSLTYTNIANPAYSRPFQLVIGDEKLDISISTYDQFDWAFPSWDSYITGYLYNTSIPADIELDGSLIVPEASAYGEGLQTATASFNSNVGNVRSIAVLYNEQAAVPYRTYVENELATYLFNGGADGSLIGSPDPSLTFAEFIRILELSIYTYSIAISPLEDSLAVINYTSNTLLIYETSSGAWDINNVTEIPLEHSTASSTLGYSADGSCLLIGLPEADNGEGRAIIYRRTLAGWQRELIVGSPVPVETLGGFGYSVCSNSTASVLYASELGSSTVYKFEKAGELWSAEPIEAFIGTDRYGFHIACSNDASVLAICDPDNACYIYEEDVLAHTEAGEFNHVDIEDGYILLSSLTENETIELTSTYILAQTIAHGNVAVYDSNRNIAILNASKEVRVFKNATSYIAASNAYAIAFSDNNLLCSDIDEEQVNVLTDNPSFLPNIVQSVFLNGQAVNSSTVLDTNKPALIVINLSSAIEVRKLGELNGVFYGLLLFDSVLSSQDVSTLWLKLKQFYKLEEYSIYAT